jgi:hypothetical protein
MSRHRSQIVLIAIATAVAASVGCSFNQSNVAGSSPDGSAPESADSGMEGGSAAQPDGASSSPDAALAGKDVSVAARAHDDAMAAAICAKLTSCCSDSDYAIFFARFSDKPYSLKTAPPRGQCAQVLGDTLWNVDSKWSDSAKRGRMTFDATRGAACVDSVKASSCGVSFSATLDDACLGLRGNEIWKKIAPTGSACQDIGDGTFYGECNPAQGFCGSMQTCEAWGKPGDACGLTPRKFCGPDLECDGSTPSKPGTCTQPPITKHLGDSCGASTGPLELCEAGTFCDFDTSKCVAQKADGASCQFDEECKSAHPYTCFPAGTGTCGSVAFCGGSPK